MQQRRVTPVNTSPKHGPRDTPSAAGEGRPQSRRQPLTSQTLQLRSWPRKDCKVPASRSGAWHGMASVGPSAVKSVQRIAKAATKHKQLGSEDPSPATLGRQAQILPSESEVA